MAPPQFGYWQCQGIGQPARMMLKYNNETHEDTVYDFHAKEGTKTHWPSQKFKMGLPFPNIPFYIDGNIKLSQSGAILRHLGKKYKMYGANDNEASIIDMLLDLSADLRLGLAKQAYSQPDFEKMRKEMIEKNVPVFKQVSEFLQSKKFLMGDSITIADFPIYDALKWHLAMEKDILSEFGNLLDYIKRFEDDPKIKAFLSSDKAFKGFFSIKAHWGGA